MLVAAMINRIIAVVLVLVCLGLGIGLVMVKNKAGEEKTRDTASILDLSNQLVTTTGKWEAEKQMSAELYKSLDTQKKALTELTNDLEQAALNLSQSRADLDKTASSLKTSQAELAKRDARISQLEGQNQALDKQATGLSSSITNLTLQIADTEMKLATSEGDRAFLQKELKRLMAEKAELERQFNDINVLRAQVSKLKEEMNIAHRIELIRQGLFATSEEKGATKLMQGAMAPRVMQARAPKPAYDLNVEVSADGSVKVIPPLPPRPATNAAVTK
jgi:chromosome segregation ATPase